MTEPIAYADANASRAFFVQMLTRDITLEDCVLDLLDNSVDGAWRSIGHIAPTLDDGADLSPFCIDIRADEGGFWMSDNCGGMDLQRAENHAFTFGRKDDDDEDRTGDYRIGVYGIGMKRAIFKLGWKVKINSTYCDNGIAKAFFVPIDVRAWMAQADTDWKFEIFNAEPAKSQGVAIEVTDLTRGTKSAFGNPSFQQNLRRVIARDYALHLHRGLTIVLNGVAVDASLITLLESAEFAPLRKSWDVAAEGGSVHIEILAGASAAPPDDEAPDEDDRGEERYGWYVACNGRIVLAGDKSTTSIWGLEGFPIWHRQYRGFIGLILFTSDETELLPLTTTKRSVDLSSEVFRSARPTMREVTRAWIDYTGARKQAREVAKVAEQAAKSVSLFSIAQNPVIVTPTLPAKPKIKTSTIQYSMAVTRIRALATEFGNVNLSAREVGMRSFDYAYDDMVGEE
ncbi:ATP-binding protein [Novosphingobium lentum]|uniref:ATP-binding protein n=1 Tax=Novosphingobium lentum TaxID=145287 RepID=UPI000836F1F0|nr:ATP-binding protein [Novosphingobium lentum]